MKMFLHQLRSEQRLYWRSRESAVFTFIFPLLLFVLLGSVYNGRYYDKPAPQVLLADLFAYACAMVTFAGLSIVLVIRREQSLLKRLRATPLPAPTFIAAMLASTLIVFAAETVALFTLGAVVYGTPFPSEIGSMIAVVVFSGICFAAMGVGLAGLIRSAEGSSAVVNLIVLPMAFLSGAFGPTLHYPHVLRVIGSLLPLTYVVRLSQGIYLFNQPIWSQPRSLLILGAWGLAGLVLARLKFSWQPHGT